MPKSANKPMPFCTRERLLAARRCTKASAAPAHQYRAVSNTALSGALGACYRMNNLPLLSGSLSRGNSTRLKYRRQVGLGDHVCLAVQTEKCVATAGRGWPSPFRMVPACPAGGVNPWVVGLRCGGFSLSRCASTDLAAMGRWVRRQASIT